MMETLIAVGVGVVVVFGILTLVWRIITGDRQQQRLDEELARFMPEQRAEQTLPAEKKAESAKKGKS